MPAVEPLPAWWEEPDWALLPALAPACPACRMGCKGRWGVMGPVPYELCSVAHGAREAAREVA